VDAQFRLAVSERAELSFGGNNLLAQRPALWTPAFDRQFFLGMRVRWSAAE
jgi:outer membrane receptor protein involved in Fe transport